MRTRHPRGFTIIELMVVVAILVILVALLLPAILAAREAARRAGCASNFRQLGLAMQTYHDSANALPIGIQMEPRRCWSFAVLGQLEQGVLFNRINFDVPFYDITNTTAILVNLAVFDCPAEPNPATIEEPPSWYPRAKANMAVNFGQTTHDQAAYSPYEGVAFIDAPFRAERSTNFADFRDGLSGTMLMSEFIIGTNGPNGSDHRGDFYNNDTNCSVFTTFLAPNSPRADQVPGWCQYPNASNPPCIDAYPSLNAARSFHRGGVNTLRADGSVHFVGGGVELALWRGSSSIAGGEIDPADRP